MGGNGKVKEGQQTLQEIFAQLDEVIAGMEQEEVSLEETFELYHKGMDMLKLCNERIDKVEKKIMREKNMNLKAEFLEDQKAKTEEIETILKEFLPREEGYQKIIMEAMGYSLLAGGKRLRPMLMKEVYLLFSEGTENLEEKKALHAFMAAQEMIHTYSLVHDDLPAMDDDEYRRGRKTTHVVFGEDMGILAGDALLNFAFETAAGAFSNAPSKWREIADALQILSKKAGIYGMIGGQVIDVKETGHAVSGEILDTIYELKTAALIESSMMIGAILGGAKESEVRIVEQIAKNVGIAFQVQDDILDVTGTASTLGKPVHSDEKNEKTTYVTLYGVEHSKKIVEEKSRQAIDMLKELPGEHAYLEQLLIQLIYREK